MTICILFYLQLVFTIGCRVMEVEKRSSLILAVYVKTTIIVISCAHVDQVTLASV